MSTELFVGIDVSKDSLEIGIYPSMEAYCVPNSDPGLDELVLSLEALGAQLIVCEATGGYETLAVSRLAAAKLPILVANARHVRDFAKSIGKLAKTDAIDAGVIARFAQAVRPELRSIKDQASQELSALITRRRQIVDMITAERHRLTKASQRSRRDIEAHVRWLHKRLEQIDDQIKRDIHDSPIWRTKDKILRSTIGVGPAMSSTLIGYVPELGQLTGKQISSLIGVAPLAHDSGRLRGRRIIWGGRAHVRSVLYMSTRSAVTHNPVIRDFYQRLRGKGKCYKVAMVACMRKLLVILNAMLRDQTTWNHC